MPLSLILASSPPFTNHDSSHCSSAALPHADMLHPCVCASPRRSRSGQVLVHLWEKHEEVPFVAAYRKALAADLRRY